MFKQKCLDKFISTKKFNHYLLKYKFLQKCLYKYV